MPRSVRSSSVTVRGASMTRNSLLDSELGLDCADSSFDVPHDAIMGVSATAVAMVAANRFRRNCGLSLMTVGVCCCGMRS